MKHVITLFTILAFAAVAHADNKDKADALFKQGKKLMTEKRYADACDAFEKSNKLDPTIGTQLNIAKCYEDWGKLGRAFLAYQAAEKLARDQKDEREPKIRERVAALEPQVPRLTINVPKNAPDSLKVTLDNRPVDKLGEPIVVDPGPHVIEWSVRGGQKQDKVVPIERGRDSQITLDLAGRGGDDKPAGGGSGGEANGGNGNDVDQEDKPEEPVTPKPPGRNQRIGGIALGGAGVIAIGVASYMTLSARGRYNDALEAHCGGMKDNCDMTGLEITRDARSTANKATVVFLIGAAMVGGGVALYVLAPKGPAPAPAEEQALYLTPTVSPDAIGIVLGGKL